MPKIDVNGTSFHYIQAGHGPDVVMLHGFLGNLAVWHLQIVPAMRREFRFTTYDLRGHGYSAITPNGYTTAQMAQDLKALLEKLGIERPVLAGHSFGADICMYYALLYPERVSKLIALEPGLACLVQHRKDKNWIGWAAWIAKLEEAGLTVPEDKRNDIDYLLQLSLETPKFYGPARGLPRNREPLLRLLRTTTLLDDYENPGELTADAVSRIQTPTLLIYGEHSHFISSYHFIHKALPHCRSVLLPGGEHFGPLEQPEMLIECMAEFLREPETGPSGAPRPPHDSPSIDARSGD